MLRPKQRISISCISAFDCFESGFITDLKTLECDPLDVLIPNKVSLFDESDEEEDNNCEFPMENDVTMSVEVGTAVIKGADVDPADSLSQNP